jgi:hypothetical protein
MFFIKVKIKVQRSAVIGISDVNKTNLLLIYNKILKSEILLLNYHVEASSLLTSGFGFN